MADRYEYRVVYARVDWVQPGFRLFQVLGAAERFVDRLNAGNRPDLSPLADVWIERRTVGTWAEVWRG